MEKAESTVVDALKEIQARMDKLEKKIDTISKTLGAEIDKIGESSKIISEEMERIEENLPHRISEANLSRKTKKVVRIMQGVGADEKGFLQVDDIITCAKGHKIMEHMVRDALDELHRLELVTDPLKGEVRLHF